MSPAYHVHDLLSWSLSPRRRNSRFHRGITWLQNHHYIPPWVLEPIFIETTPLVSSSFRRPCRYVASKVLYLSVACFNVHWPKPRIRISRVTIRSFSLLTAMDDRPDYIQKGWANVNICNTTKVCKTYCFMFALPRFFFSNELYGSIRDVLQYQFLPVKNFCSLNIEKGRRTSSHTGREKKWHLLSTKDKYLPKLSGLLTNRGHFLSFTLYRRVDCVDVRRRSIQPVICVLVKSSRSAYSSRKMSTSVISDRQWSLPKMKEFSVYHQRTRVSLMRN